MANIRRISKDEYRALLEAGKRFRDWSLYEPSQKPDRVYYVIDMGPCTLNKTEVTM